MITTEHLQQFSVQCLQWAEHVGDPSNRQIIIGVAHQWSRAAAALEQRLDDGAELVDDLQTKLD